MNKPETNSQYHVFGIGNALVDIEVEVTAEELERYGVEKGVMTLIDAERQEELLKHLHGTQHSRACGGSAANTMIGLAQLGGKSYYTCKVASDETGDFYYADLRRNGVDSCLAASGRPAGVTGKCLVMVTPDADRTMNTFLGITSDIGPEDIVLDALKASEYVYVEGYLVSAPTSFAAAKECLRLAREHDVKTAVSFSDPAMARYFGQNLAELVAEPVDLLFCNDEEARVFTGAADLDSACEAMRRHARRFAVTCGPKGARLFDGERMLEVAPHVVKAIDTNGAGDLFAAAFLAALCQGLDFGKAGQLASLSSARLVTQFGPRMNRDNLATVREFQKELLQGELG
ncbi:MAG: adenosine kinase [Gammaproteobacteria bacterium]|nr:adenosine kinase [Gammaproteobacteria bacterium]